MPVAAIVQQPLGQCKSRCSSTMIYVIDILRLIIKYVLRGTQACLRTLFDLISEVIEWLLIISFHNMINALKLSFTLIIEKLVNNLTLNG